MQRKVSFAPGVSINDDDDQEDTVVFPAEEVRTLRHRIYLAMEGGLHPWDKIIETIVLILIVLNVIFFIITSVEWIFNTAGTPLMLIELVCVIIFTIEFAIRLWCSIERPKYAKHGALFGRIRFIISIASIIDMIAFFPYWVGFAVAWTQTGTPFIDGISFLSAIRIFRVFHLFKVRKYTHAVAIFTEILKNNKEILATVLMYETTLFLVTATALYYAERKPAPLVNTFASIPDAMYTSVLVLTGHTVPYKELTVGGQWVIAVACILSVIIIAIPAGVIAWGFKPVENKYVAYKKAKKEEKIAEQERLMREVFAEGFSILGDSDNDEDDGSSNRKQPAPSPPTKREQPKKKKKSRSPVSEEELADPTGVCPHCQRAY